MKFLKVSFIFFSLIFLNGCLQSTALLGPGVTVVSTGNVLQAVGQPVVIRGLAGDGPPTALRRVARLQLAVSVEMRTVDP